FYVFSTNAYPFEHETSYSKFAAYALLNHNGDYKAAARAIAERFGMKNDPVDRSGHEDETEAQRDKDFGGKNSRQKLSDEEIDALLGVTKMSTVKREEISWLWKGRIALGKVTLLEGDPGLGKSHIALALATHVSLGHGLPGEQKTDPLNVLIMSAEDGLGDTIGPRLDSMGADSEKILAISKPVVFDTAGCAAIDNLIGRRNPRLIVIDPLFSYTDAKVDIHRGNESRDVMTRISALAEKHKCAIVCIRHLTKGGRDKSIYRGVGSIDFTAAVRSVLLVGADATDRNRRAVVQT